MFSNKISFNFVLVEGNLLIAHPLLNDGFFNRSVIYLINDNEEGAFGFMLNLKTELKLRDLRPHINNGNFPIFEGGPVAKDQLFFIHTIGLAVTNAHHVKDNVYFGGNFDVMLDLIEQGKVKQNQVRFFIGYSGWGEGQLQNEIETRSWLVDESKNRDLLDIAYTDLWREKLQQINKNYGIFADIGFDPSKN